MGLGSYSHFERYGQADLLLKSYLWNNQSAIHLSPIVFTHSVVWVSRFLTLSSEAIHPPKAFWFWTFLDVRIHPALKQNNHVQTNTTAKRMQAWIRFPTEGFARASIHTTSDASHALHILSACMRLFPCKAHTEPYKCEPSRCVLYWLRLLQGQEKY